MPETYHDEVAAHLEAAARVEFNRVNEVSKLRSLRTELTASAVAATLALVKAHSCSLSGCPVGDYDGNSEPS